MLHDHAFRSRGDLMGHLTGDLHKWHDGGMGAFREWEMVDQYGRPWMPTSEYMAIHRELHLAMPVMIVAGEAWA